MFIFVLDFTFGYCYKKQKISLFLKSVLQKKKIPVYPVSLSGFAKIKFQKVFQ